MDSKTFLEDLEPHDGPQNLHHGAKKLHDAPKNLHYGPKKLHRGPRTS